MEDQAYQADLEVLQVVGEAEEDQEDPGHLEEVADQVEGDLGVNQEHQEEVVGVVVLAFHLDQAEGEEHQGDQVVLVEAVGAAVP